MPAPALLSGLWMSVIRIPLFFTVPVPYMDGQYGTSMYYVHCTVPYYGTGTVTTQIPVRYVNGS